MKRVIRCIAFLILVHGCATQGVYHTVEEGQTLWRIAKTYNVDVRTLARVNGIRDPSHIEAGQRLFIPGARRVKKVRSYIPRERAVKKGRFIWPVRGKVIVGFGDSEGHRSKGIEIAAKAGTPVLASDDGEVVYSGDGIRGLGNVIVIRHRGGFYTTYANNQRNLVKAGQRVKQGERIATVGYSRLSNTYALYFEIRVGKKARNPLLFLP